MASILKCIYNVLLIILFIIAYPIFLFPPGKDQPSVKHLLKFPSKGKHINFITKCSFNYRNLGIWLLDDENANIVESLEIEYHYNAERITTEIFKRWIRGDGLKPISWDALVQLLQDADLHNLAVELQDALCS